jgi:hypothetical protein
VVLVPSGQEAAWTEKQNPKMKYKSSMAPKADENNAPNG